MERSTYRPPVEGLPASDVIKIGDAVVVEYFKRRPGEAAGYLASDASAERELIEKDLSSGASVADVCYDQGRATVRMLTDEGIDPRLAFDGIVRFDQ